MLENTLAKRQPFELAEPREPSESEIQEARRRALQSLTRIEGATSLYHEDGRTWVAEALSEGLSATYLRDLTDQIHAGYNSPQHDYCEIGRVIVQEIVEPYLTRLDTFEHEVYRQVALMRENAAEMARTDDDF